MIIGIECHIKKDIRKINTKYKYQNSHFMPNLSYAQALNKSAALCSRGEKCRSDIQEKLRQWSVSQEDSDKVIAFLEEKDFLNEKRFAHAYTNDKFKFNKWGKLKISAGLKQKRIPSTLIEAAISEIDATKYIETLTELLAAKKKSTKETDCIKLKAKLFRFAQTRGFEFGISLEIAEKISCTP